MKRLVILTSAFLMASPVVGLAQGSAGKPVAAPAEKPAAAPAAKGADPYKDNDAKPADAKTGATVDSTDPKVVAAKFLGESSKVKIVPLRDAPDFAVKDAGGKTVKLADYKGKWVVLEWTNHHCPFVKKHYSSGNMQALQKTFTQKDVVWLTVHSSAKGKQGYLDAAGIKAEIAKSGAAPTASLIDADGKMGKAYEAKNTPHMFIINPDQKLVYVGAIDDNDSADAAVIPTSKNYVAEVLTASMGSDSKTMKAYSTRPYGCSVKY